MANKIVGTLGRDKLKGTIDDDTIIGDQEIVKNDIVTGADDVLHGGSAGNDELAGDVYKNDGYYGETSELIGGDDKMQGADGNDTLYGDARQNIGWYNGNAETTGGNDNMKGGDGNDNLVGDVRNNDAWYDGSAKVTGGDDNMHGGDGNDTLVGDVTTNFALYGNSEVIGGDDNLKGGDGDDTLVGDVQANYGGTVTGGNDTLKSGAGNDTLVGDVANDYGTSTGGSDTFKFTSDDLSQGSDPYTDIIKDFHTEEGDVIDVSEMLNYDSSTHNINNFIFVDDEVGTAKLVFDTEGNSTFDDHEIILRGIAPGDVDLEALIESGNLVVEV
jgi:Ca2+-binding RTX toxin-like protein